MWDNDLAQRESGRDTHARTSTRTRTLVTDAVFMSAETTRQQTVGPLSTFWKVLESLYGVSQRNKKTIEVTFVTALNNMGPHNLLYKSLGHTLRGVVINFGHKQKSLVK